MNIVVEDWDDLAEARRRRDARTGPAPNAEATDASASLTGVSYDDDEAYGATVQNLRLPAFIAGGNVAVWVAGRLFDVVELVGVAFFASIALLLAAYLLREWQRDRTALICLAGALPLPVTIIGLFY
jgi:hypothetical protein